MSGQKDRWVLVRAGLIGLAAGGLAGLGVTASGCEEQGPAERAGEQIDEAAEEAGEALEDAGEELDPNR